MFMYGKPKKVSPQTFCINLSNIHYILENKFRLRKRPCWRKDTSDSQPSVGSYRDPDLGHSLGNNTVLFDKHGSGPGLCKFGQTRSGLCPGVKKIWTRPRPGPGILSFTRTRSLPRRKISLPGAKLWLKLNLIWEIQKKKDIDWQIDYIHIFSVARTFLHLIDV